MIEIALVFLPLLGAVLAGLNCRAFSDRVAQLLSLALAVLLVFFHPFLAGLSLIGIAMRMMGDRGAQWVTSGFMIVSALLSWVIFFGFLSGDSTAYVVPVLRWLAVGDFIFHWELRIDTLTAVMFIVVTTVSAVVHLYSIGYMSHDDSKSRFMAYLSLFTFMMLMLVSANNFVQMFFGWEGVGLASYLLIGFWYKKPSANAAAIKAFVVNRVGDFGFALGIFAVFVLTGSVEFDVVFAHIPGLKDASFVFLDTEYHAITVAALLLFMGAMGKSAQLGLHTWLPDAMEGPTPVSALIHAATMVTAGVFMVCRLSPIIEFSETALMVITFVGATTAIFAASIGLTQNDIKRVIAYSTCSQLGYMFFAVGVSAYPAAMFHLTTHAFFKALLFLGAGSVIHAMSDEQDMRRMGGIYKFIPFTYILMWIGSLALAGMPFFAGYYSKDIILESAFAAHTGLGTYAYWMGIAAALMTAFYSWRLIFMTFHGPAHAEEKVMAHVHESPRIMLYPLVVLALGAIGSGFLLAPYFVGDYMQEFWQSSIFIADNHQALHHAHDVSGWPKHLPTVVGVVGILSAYLIYISKPDLAGMLARRFSWLYNLSFNKYYIDELYDAIFVRPAFALGRKFWSGDTDVIDRYGPDGVCATTNNTAFRLGALQSGYIYHYAFAMLIGLVVLVGVVLFW